MDRFDFIIQIIGAPDSGKSTIAHMIEEILHRNRVMIQNADHPLDNKEEDWKDVHGKKVLITTFRAQNDPQVIDEEK